MPTSTPPLAHRRHQPSRRGRALLAGCAALVVVWGAACSSDSTTGGTDGTTGGTAGTSVVRDTEAGTEGTTAGSTPGATTATTDPTTGPPTSAGDGQGDATSSTASPIPDDQTAITPGNEAFCDRLFLFGRDVADLQNAEIDDPDAFGQQFMELYRAGFTDLAELAPDEIKADVDLFAGAIRQAQSPEDLANFDGPTYDDAANRLDDWIVVNCGFSMDDF